ncbi:MAG: hypothetical protein HGA87_01335 [Desulfobulbaceae bacterium]|nr:hypothetical protein [Desulfobulbaceae bacterium]
MNKAKYKPGDRVKLTVQFYPNFEGDICTLMELDADGDWWAEFDSARHGENIWCVGRDYNFTKVEDDDGLTESDLIGGIRMTKSQGYLEPQSGKPDEFDVAMKGYATHGASIVTVSIEHWHDIENRLTAAHRAAIDAHKAAQEADISRRVMENIEAGRFPGEGLMGDDDGDA